LWQRCHNLFRASAPGSLAPLYLPPLRCLGQRRPRRLDLRSAEDLRALELDENTAREALNDYEASKAGGDPAGGSGGEAGGFRHYAENQQGRPTDEERCLARQDR